MVIWIVSQTKKNRPLTTRRHLLIRRKYTQGP
jgi:hypothetical protein